MQKKKSNREKLLNFVWRHTLVSVLLLLWWLREHNYTPFTCFRGGLWASWDTNGQISLFVYWYMLFFLGCVYWYMLFFFWGVCGDPLAFWGLKPGMKEKMNAKFPLKVSDCNCMFVCRSWKRCCIRPEKLKSWCLLTITLRTAVMTWTSWLRRWQKSPLSSRKLSHLSLVFTVSMECSSTCWWLLWGQL